MLGVCGNSSPHSTVSLNILLTKEDWSHQWQGGHKSTSSSKSELHFGHYLAGIKSDHISHFHALKASFIIKRGIVLDQWACGRSVILENIFGCTLITKLQSILLMEADFNATNKVIYGYCLMDTIRKYKLMPEEIFSEKNHWQMMAPMQRTYFMTLFIKLAFWL
jgi:hypothetical protein